MKFGILQQILDPITVTWSKIEIFKIQDAAILKIVESPYLSDSIWCTAADIEPDDILKSTIAVS